MDHSRNWCCFPGRPSGRSPSSAPAVLGNSGGWRWTHPTTRMPTSTPHTRAPLGQGGRQLLLLQQQLPARLVYPVRHRKYSYMSAHTRMQRHFNISKIVLSELRRWSRVFIQNEISFVKTSFEAPSLTVAPSCHTFQGTSPYVLKEAISPFTTNRICFCRYLRLCILWRCRFDLAHLVVFNVWVNYILKLFSCVQPVWTCSAYELAIWLTHSHSHPIPRVDSTRQGHSNPIIYVRIHREHC